ncbi:DUF6036 family nucleotidyltransferase [Cellulomonas composti]|uniref:DUF6036 family nucleotidyltransferase n=1 Tax=Cellulomonas composti TaxID=266130 RepID=UPI0027D9882E|nr:DUF6036 family nucleotidyltransferase [Cellulomonas composti]
MIIIGSQAALASWDEDELPAAATMSTEIDICPMHDDDAETLADKLDGAIGELSRFHQTHGFYIQGVGRETALLAPGWTDRLVAVKVAGADSSTGWCLEIHDLCAAKLLANRAKDHAYVAAMIQESFVDPNVVWDRVAGTDTDARRIEAAQRWLLGPCRVWSATGRTARPPTYEPA